MFVFDATPPVDQYILPNGYAIKPTPDPIRYGYIFGGWFTTSACSGSAINFPTYKITSDQTLYAKWTVAPTPVITGSTPICSGSSKNFSATNWQPGYEWSSDIGLTFGDKNSSSTTVSKSLKTLLGAGYEKVMSGSTVLAQYPVWVGEPPETAVLSIVKAGFSAVYAFTATSIPSSVGASSLFWESYAASSGGSPVFSFTSFVPQGSYSFQNSVHAYYAQVKVVNTCGTGPASSSRYQYTVAYGNGGDEQW